MLQIRLLNLGDSWHGHTKPPVTLMHVSGHADGSGRYCWRCKLLKDMALVDGLHKNHSLKENGFAPDAHNEYSHAQVWIQVLPFVVDLESGFIRG